MSIYYLSLCQYSNRQAIIKHSGRSSNTIEASVLPQFLFRVLETKSLGISRIAVLKISVVSKILFEDHDLERFYFKFYQWPVSIQITVLNEKFDINQQSAASKFLSPQLVLFCLKLVLTKPVW